MSFANFKSSKNGYLGRVTKIRDCKFAHSISRRRWAGFEAIKMITVGRVGFDELNDTVRRRIGPDGSPACQVAGRFQRAILPILSMERKAELPGGIFSNPSTWLARRFSLWKPDAVTKPSW